MIKLKFKNKNKELEFFKKIHYLSEILRFEIKYAELINDLDVTKSEEEDE